MLNSHEQVLYKRKKTQEKTPFLEIKDMKMKIVNDEATDILSY